MLYGQIAGALSRGALYIYVKLSYEGSNAFPQCCVSGTPEYPKQQRDKSINEIHYFIAINILECVMYCFVSWCLGWHIIFLFIGFDSDLRPPLSCIKWPNTLWFHSIKAYLPHQYQSHPHPLHPTESVYCCFNWKWQLCLFSSPFGWLLHLFFSILPQLMPSTSLFP